MDLTASGAGIRGASATRAAARGRPAALTLLCGTVLSLTGLTWDVQWHSDVGPDTFFTLPHLFLYAGSAIAGLASLAVVLATTAAQRAGRPIDPSVGGRAVAVFGRTFAAPLGYLVSGVGAASFLLYGLWDQWWHGLYGFDAVIDSPPHIGLLLSITVTMIGAVMVFSAAGHQTWGALGALVGVAVLMAFSTVTVLGLQDVDGVVNAIDAGTAFLSVLLVLLAAGLRARPGGALIAAAMLAVLQAVFWWFSPWAAHVYADAVGLPVRDYILGIPEMPSLFPMCLVPVAAVVELLLWNARRRGAPPRWTPVLAGGIGGLLVAACAPVQSSWIYPMSHFPDAATMIATSVAGALLGLLAGFLGWRFGRMLRLLTPAGGQ
ncbi:hypothetical protein [Amycolatopsis anabasis]|uniref:hypothetical protein n=1 Tax=Amycolatopsis anabasis TaxID=1840409 RepID=UPI00131DB2B1|nr:hypothetical protein [Amycolatopsis anabasis]